MAIRVMQGGEYRGETYIWCDVHTFHGTFPVRADEGGVFESETLSDLLAFIDQHRQHERPT